MAAAKKKKKEKSKKKRERTKSFLANLFEKHLGKICLGIALLDLAHAFFFVVQAMKSLVTRLNVYSVLALLGSIFWFLIVIVLIVGLNQRRPALVKAWIIFSIAGFVADIGFLIWGIISSVTVDWDHLREFSIIFMGIFIESVCIYLVHRYYLIMDPCRIITDAERPSRKAYQDPKKCRESQRSARKKSEKSKRKPVKKKK